MSGIESTEKQSVRFGGNTFFRDEETILEGFKKVSSDKILSKIFVSRPYYAFQEVFGNDEYLVSYITPERISNSEAGPITAAEIGRHLAILGSCIHGLGELDRCYYLAAKARLDISYEDDLGKLQGISKEEKLIGVCKNVYSDKKSCRSSMIIMDQSFNVLYTLNTEYSKISDRLFKRLFSKYLLDYQKSDSSPYTNLVSSEEKEVGRNKMRCDIPVIEPYQCSGHFDSAPLLPIAINMGIIIDAAGKFLSKIVNDNSVKYIVSVADIQADSFVPISKGNYIEIDFVKVDLQNKDYHFSCSTCRNGTTMNTSILVLRVV